jgi:hypothetical protein
LGQQQQTRDWWNTSRNNFELVCSELVVQEASAGDASAAAHRIAALQGIRLLAIASEVPSLAARLSREIQLPSRAKADALHVAIAATNGVDFLLTWNCRHLSNAVLRPRIEWICRDSGYEPPVICTPAELMEDEP